MTPSRRAARPSSDPIKQATLTAIRRLLEPLLELLLDAGVTVQECNALVREQAVIAATKRVLDETGRGNAARVAIMTGLPRSEVAKLAKSVGTARTRPDLHPARRVLAAWYDDSRFLTTEGEPAVLDIFGRKKSFEALVAAYGGGLPVRAMLDELTQMNAVDHLPNQRIAAKSRTPILTGLTSRSIAAVGDRGKDHLQTLLQNVRQKSKPLFEATAVINHAAKDSVPVLRQELEQQGASFINAANSLLNRSKRGRMGRRPSKSAGKSAKPDTTYRLGVTLYYFQDEMSTAAADPLSIKQIRRRNLRRQEKTR